MLRKVLIGASTLALLGGAAQAATNQFQVIQNGNSNSANGNQSGGTNEIAYIEQVGNSNSATTNQQGGGNSNNSFLTQRGNQNVASVTENGVRNESDTFQGCGFRQGNPALGSRCGGGGETPVANTHITESQSGTDGFTFVFQAADGNSATITQDGANMGRGSIPAGSRLGSVSANADIEQYHNDNSATVVQHNSSTLFAEANPDVGFDGSEGNVTILQGVRYDVSTDPPGQPVTTTPPLDSPGQNNSASVTQNIGATNSYVLIAQGVSDNLATVTQNGLDEFLEIRQDGPAGNGGNNTADVTQTGDRTTAFIYQFGISNSATLNQITNGSLADIRQMGNLNHANITQ